MGDIHKMIETPLDRAVGNAIERENARWLEDPPIEAANAAAWSPTIERTEEDISQTRSFLERMAAGRAAVNPPAVYRLQCPTAEHGEGVILYVRHAEGWCHCHRKLRPLAMDERLVKVNGRVVTVKR
jgi:hypothetical protein